MDVAPGRWVASPGGRGSEQRGRRRWKQEVECGRARVDTPTSFWRKEEGDWHGPGGPAQPGKWPPGLSLLFLFSSVFYFPQVCFEFKIIQTMPKTPLNIFILLDGLFQKLIKYFRGI